MEIPDGQTILRSQLGIAFSVNHILYRRIDRLFGLRLPQNIKVVAYGILTSVIEIHVEFMN